MRSSFFCHALPLLPTSLLFGATIGCVSAQTEQNLDRANNASSVLLQELPESKPKARVRKVSVPDLSGPIEREAVLAQIISRSPPLAVMAHQARALVHAGRAEGSLPPSEIGFEAWNLPLTRPYELGEADMYMVELRQRFPAAGSLDARAQAMAEEAQALLFEISAEERLVAEQALAAFIEYERAHVEQKLLNRQLDLLGRMRELARARYTTGGAGLVEIPRLNLEVSKTRRSLARTQGEIARSRSALNALLGRPPDKTLGQPRESSPETVSLSVEELMALAKAQRGTTLSNEARVRAAEARRKAASIEAKVPEFMVGLGYFQDPNMRAGVGLTASMSLPWLWGPGRHRVSQMEEEALAERSATDGATQSAQMEVSEAYVQMRSLEEQLRIVQREALPAAHRSLDALSAAFTTGNASLLDWVEAARTVLDLEMEVTQLHSDLALSVASLERAVGAPLPHVPLDAKVTP